jgi:ribosomal-protein-serine acetyltransferase
MAAPESIQLDDGIQLRLLSTEDAPAVFATVDANREHLRIWLPWVDHSLRVEDTSAFLVDHVNRREQGTALGYGLWQGERLGGIIGIHDLSQLDRHAKIGYWLSKEWEGRGRMLSAVQALLGVCFRSLSLERVEILCAVGNNRSSAIPERLGFHFEGVLRHAQLLNGRFVDLRLYSLLGEEFRP